MRRNALISGLRLRYEKSPGLGFEKVRVAVRGEDVDGSEGPLGRGTVGPCFENFLSRFDVKKRGPEAALRVAAGLVDCSFCWASGR